MEIDGGKLGPIDFSTIPLPGFVRELLHPIYLSSGSILLGFRTGQDLMDFYHLAVMDDDGGNFREIFAGAIPQHETANGTPRLMPSTDNTKVLLGDYILECHPSIDQCSAAELIPVEYPVKVMQDPALLRHWSEMIIAPDNEHMAWTVLYRDGGAVNFYGLLERYPDRYSIRNVQVISSTQALAEDPKNPGLLIPLQIRGGEIKQFIRGGTAISLVGSIGAPLPDSIVQDLLSEEIVPITQMPGYEETAILSPDERLGLVMSTRGSPATNCAILGLLPRPFGYLVVHDLIWKIYLYAVAGVRRFRPGNIGPVLIDIDRSIQEPGYLGVQLHDPEGEWVYLSPMSWHPSSCKAIWPELRCGEEEIRVRRVDLPEYCPGPRLPVQRTPETIPYGVPIDAYDPDGRQQIKAGKIAGKFSGHLDYNRQANRACQVTYVDYSEDGTCFYNGFERLVQPGESCYEADLTLSGIQQGEMKLRLTFSESGYDDPTYLLFDKADDGKPKSYGYARYGDVELRVEDMER